MEQTFSKKNQVKHNFLKKNQVKHNLSSTWKIDQCFNEIIFKYFKCLRNSLLEMMGTDNASVKL